MPDTRTYSITELCQLSGFDRRTIVYYMHQGLLPKPGRRGPRTRHTQACMDRLRFIRGIKDLQDQGRSGTITLLDIGRMLAGFSEAQLRAALERGLPENEVQEWLAAASAPPLPPEAPPATVPTVGDGRRYGLADAGIRRQPPAGAPDAAAPASPPDADLASIPTARPPPGPLPPLVMSDDLGELLRTLEVRPALTGRRLAPGASEHWTEIPITSRVYLSVRGLSADDAPLADATARALKKLLRPR